MSIPEASALILIILSCIYYILSTCALVSHFGAKPRKRAESVTESKEVSILKPVCGSDPDSKANYRSFLAQNYPDFEVIFGALEQEDTATTDVREIIQGWNNATLYSGGKAKGYNNKCLILDNLIQYATGEIFIIADADTRVTPDAVARVTAPFIDPSVGLVTCMYRGVDVKNTSDAIEALYMTSIFEPGVACAKALGVGFCLGAMVALRRSVLEEIGGFGPICDYLADDFRLGKIVRGAGYKVVLSDYIVDIVLSKESFSDVLARQLRWSQTLRVCNPLGHFGLLVTHGFAYSILFWLLTGFSMLGWWVLLGCGLIRYVMSFVGVRICLQDKGFAQRMHLIPASDLLSLYTWGAAYFSRRVKWRGRRLKLSKDGRILSDC